MAGILLGLLSHFSTDIIQHHAPCGTFQCASKPPYTHSALTHPHSSHLHTLTQADKQFEDERRREAEAKMYYEQKKKEEQVCLLHVKTSISTEFVNEISKDIITLMASTILTCSKGMVKGH